MSGTVTRWVSHPAMQMRLNQHRHARSCFKTSVGSGLRALGSGLVRNTIAEDHGYCPEPRPLSPERTEVLNEVLLQHFGRTRFPVSTGEVGVRLELRPRLLADNPVVG